ncbi:MAG TPA: zeta toxin family protein, partial [Longimicrobium sp.]|nr:zeta toxin family protein [Longimicrobium sp.]
PPGTAAAIVVLAGVNGAGKSSLLGAEIQNRTKNERLDYFNPDAWARSLRETNPGLTVEEANGLAWTPGKMRLQNAITSRTNFTFETTLGGNTIPSLLERAHDSGLAVRVWFVGLESPELHIARVKARVAAGGHDIPTAKIRERYERSRANLIRLLPKLTALRVFDNSAEGDPRTPGGPSPRLILSMNEGKIIEFCALEEVPDWAKPIVVAAFRTYSI